jgi:hypothetical protein
MKLKYLLKSKLSNLNPTTTIVINVLVNAAKIEGKEFELLSLPQYHL